MKAKRFTFVFPLAFVADNVDQATSMLQEELRDWEESVMDAENWEVEVEEVEVTEGKND